MTIPIWLKQRLGNPKRGRGCRATKCIVCKTDILAGFDEDQMALPAIADPVPLSRIGEALACVEGRKTYKLDRLGEGLALWVRNALHIRSHPASEETIVLADHICNRSPLPSIEIKPAPSLAKKGLPYDAEPPF